jgi:hypothetical protein
LNVERKEPYIVKQVSPLANFSDVMNQKSVNYEHFYNLKQIKEKNIQN